MAFEQITNSIKEVTDQTQDYVKVSTEYYKLSIFRNGMKGLVGAANLMIRGTVGILCLLFLSIGLAIYISEKMGHASAGYFIVGAVYFVIFILVVVFVKKPLEKKLLEKYSKMALNQEESNKQGAMQTTPSKQNVS